jgi:hypothetical protein
MMSAAPTGELAESTNKLNQEISAALVDHQT